MVMVAVFGVAVILLVVVAGLLLRKRLVTVHFISTVNVCHSDKYYLQPCKLCDYVPQVQLNEGYSGMTAQGEVMSNSWCCY